jgi:hypothetical protein
MVGDKKTIGITSRNAGPLADLMARGRFATELDAAKFAMAHAINMGIAPGVAEGTETKWNVGSVDPDGSLRSLLEALYPAMTEPYRTMEYLMNEGIKALAPFGGAAVDPYSTLFPTPDDRLTTD